MNNEIRLSAFSYRRGNSAKTILRNIIIPIVLSCVYMLIGCGKKETTDTGQDPRPVTVLELREINPIKPLQLTGSVNSWKDEDISFEVEGRVEWIVEMATNLEGRWKEGNVVNVQGDVLARLDERSYQIKLKRAKAEKDRAQAEYVRKKNAWEKKAIAEVDFIRGTADRDAREAEFEDTEYDLERCTLYAPFSGEVSVVYVEAGGYVKRGEPVAHLVMMDPIKIDISVSSATSKRLKIRDTVCIFLPGDEEPVYGSVYEKGNCCRPGNKNIQSLNYYP